MKILISLAVSAVLAFSCQNTFVSGQSGSQEMVIMNQIISTGDNQLCVRPSQSSAMSIYSILNDENVIGGVVQGDMLNHAFEYDANSRIVNFELLFPVATKNVYLITSKNSNVNNVSQLNNKSISIGKELSDSFMSFLFLSKKLNYDWAYVNDEYETAIKKLFTGEVDGIFFISEQLSPELTKDFDKVTLVELSSPSTLYRDTLIKKSDYLVEADSERYKKIQDTKSYDVQLFAVVDKAKLTDQNSALIKEQLVKYIAKQIQSIKEKSKSIIPSQAVDEATQKAKDLGKKLFSSFTALTGLESSKKENDRENTRGEVSSQFSLEEQQVYDKFCNFKKDIRLTHSLKISDITVAACDEVKNRLLSK